MFKECLELMLQEFIKNPNLKLWLFAAAIFMSTLTVSVLYAIWIMFPYAYKRGVQFVGRMIKREDLSQRN